MPFKTYLINKINNNRFRLNGIVPSQRLPHKGRLCQAFSDHVIYTPDQLPPKVDLRPYMTSVEDQSQIGSCTANSLAGAYEYLTKKANGRNTDVSRLFIYYNARAKANNSDSVEDSGCSMTDAIEALEEFGTCLESIWPYDISNVNTRPDDQAYQQAEGHKIREALQVNLNLDEMKSCLAQGFPIAFGLKLFTSFDQAREAGVVPMPNVSDGTRQSDGSHALLAVGYSDQSRAFIVRNSWGANWGDKGYCYIPYDYMTDSDLCFDAWTVRKLANDDFGQEHWHFHDATNFLQGLGNQFFGDNDGDNRVIDRFDEDDGEFFGNRNRHRRDKRFQDDNFNQDGNYSYQDNYNPDGNAAYQDDNYNSDRNVYQNDNFNSDRNVYQNDNFNPDRNFYQNDNFNPDGNFSYQTGDQFGDDSNNFAGSRGGWSGYN